jgi:hypothetical protein
MMVLRMFVVRILNVGEYGDRAGHRCVYAKKHSG